MKRVERGESGGAGTYVVLRDQNGVLFDRELAHRRWVIESGATKPRADIAADDSMKEPGPVKGAAGEVLRAVVRRYYEERRGVTIWEVAKTRGQDPLTVSKQLVKLEASDHIRRNGELIFPLVDERGRPVRRPHALPTKEAEEVKPSRESVRSLLEAAIETIDMHPDTEFVPVLGTAAAGAPIDAALDGNVPSFELPANWIRGGPSYLLRVVGDSMSGDHIADGDLVLVRATEGVEPGKIHVVWTPSGATIKRVDEGELIASNPDHPRRPVPEGSVPQGRVIAVIRFLDKSLD